MGRGWFGAFSPLSLICIATFIYLKIFSCCVLYTQKHLCRYMADLLIPNAFLCGCNHLKICYSWASRIHQGYIPDRLINRHIGRLTRLAAGGNIFHCCVVSSNTVHCTNVAQVCSVKLHIILD